MLMLAALTFLGYALLAAGSVAGVFVGLSIATQFLDGRNYTALLVGYLLVSSSVLALFWSVQSAVLLLP